MDHSNTFGYSPRLPVSVCGTGGIYLVLRGFSWKFDYCHYPLIRRLAVLSGSPILVDLPAKTLTTPFNVLFRQYADISLLRHLFAIYASTGILTCYPSTFTFVYALGPD